MESDTAQADAHLQVEFFVFDGDGMFRGVPHIRMMTPGDATSIVVQPVRDDHKRRFPRQWLAYQMKNENVQIIGIPLAQWRQERPDELSEGQLAELQILKFYSVEQVAGASDSQIMAIAMGGPGLREIAKRYLASKNAQLAGARLEKQQDEIDMLKAAMARMAEERAKPPLPVKEKTYPPRHARRGRPPKAKGVVDENASTAGAASR
jgi:hypothetical protein